MIFSTFSFVLLFLPVVFGLYSLALRGGHAAAAKVVLVVASLVFYAVGSGSFFGWFVASVVFNFWVGRGLARRREASGERGGRWLLALGVLANLLLLGAFKYTDFAIFNLNALLGLELPYQHIVLPIGISFFTFQLVAYLVDSHRGLTAHYGLLDYLLFITFFPQLIVGPIVHHADVVPQYEGLARRSQRSGGLALGVYLFAIGCSKKLLLADPLTTWAQNGFDHAEALATLEAWAAALSYTLSYYFDLSGYADMAIGLGLLFGISLPINFDRPYRARHFAEYWQRWHITLSRFLGDYVFRSLYQRGAGSARFYLAVMGTFLVSGVWHGAGWTFVVWGVLNGAFVCAAHGMRRRGWSLPLPVAWGLTFAGVVGVRVLFVAADFDQALEVFTAALDPGRWRLDGLTQLATRQPVYLAVGMALVLAAPSSQQLRTRFRPDLRHALATAVMLVACLMHMSRPMDFLYFQF